MHIGSVRGKKIWRASFLAVIWKERIARCFEGSAMTADALVENLNFTIASWMSTNPHFHGYSIDQIFLNWREIAFFCNRGLFSFGL